MYDIVGRSDRLFPRQYVNNNEKLILIKYQTPLKSKYNNISFELITALQFSYKK